MTETDIKTEAESRESASVTLKSFDKPENFINRELSWLEFNRRVLEEAQDPTVPLLERIKFLSIFSNNLDEFFMVRVAGVRRQVDANVHTAGPDGRMPLQVLEEISRRTHELSDIQHEHFSKALVPELATAGVRVHDVGGLSTAQKQFAREYFQQSVLPVLTPLAVDPSHPFPHLINRSLYVVFELASETRDALPKANVAIVPISFPMVPRFVRLPSDRHEFILLEDLIRLCADELFSGYQVRGSYTIRLTRDSDLQYDEDPSEDLLKTISESLRSRRKGAAIRLEYEEGLSQKLLTTLIKEMDLEPEDLYACRGMIAYSDLMNLYAQLDLPEWKDPSFPPHLVRELETGSDMFTVIRQKDILVHHPYQSFDYVTRFLNEAATDPHVLAIKMTLYRIAPDSPIAAALQLAAERGKQVAALVELKARFDEDTNIAWANRLEDAGAHVIYGMAGLKTHCKVCLVVRQEKGKIRHYCHLSTGNYNERTSRTYGDIGLFTAHPRFGEDVSNLFNVLTGYLAAPKFHRIKIAPTDLRDSIIQKIRREAANARDGKPSLIIAKLNALVDRQVILELYRAGQMGVPIRLIVRGICCLRPGVKGLSENIEIISIIDRFLEHARIYYFANGGQPEYYLASADWMPRNLEQRVEVAFPVKDSKYQEDLWNFLQLQLSDTIKARRFTPDGTTVRVKSDKKKIRSQVAVYDLYRKL